MDLNKAMIIGRLTKDPELRTIPSGVSVANFSLATNFVYTNDAGVKVEKVEFHNIVMWRRLAEIAAQYLKKGAKVYIEGRLQTQSWDDPNGFKRYKTEIVAENLIMLDRAPQAGQAPPYEGYSAYQPRVPQSFDPASVASYPNELPANQSGQSASPAKPVRPAQQEEELPTIDITEEMTISEPGDQNEEEISVEDIPF